MNPVENTLKLDLPDLFAFTADPTKAQFRGRRVVSERTESGRGNLLLVEGDEEVARLIRRLFEAEGYRVRKASCVREAREVLQEERAELLLARRQSVPVNLETEQALRAIAAHTPVRIVDNFSELMLGQVVDYETMAQSCFATLDLLVSLLEAAHSSVRGHAHNVARYCRLVGQRMGLSRSELDGLTLAAYLHDVGYVTATQPSAQPVAEQPELLLRSYRPTLELLANIPFAYSIAGVIARAGTNDTPDTADAPPAASKEHLAAGILRVCDAYDVLRRSHLDRQDQEALFDWMRQQPPGTFDPAALETLIHIRKHERAIHAMNLFSATVLLVGPAPEDFQPLQLCLENEDFHVLVARSVEEALRVMRREPVTLVFCEYRVQGRAEGLTLLQTVKSDPTLTHTLQKFGAARIELLAGALIHRCIERDRAHPPGVEIRHHRLMGDEGMLAGTDDCGEIGIVTPGGQVDGQHLASGFAHLAQHDPRMFRIVTGLAK